MKQMNIARGFARALRRVDVLKGQGDKMLPPSTAAQAAHLADQQRAVRKLAVKLFHKSGAGLDIRTPRRADKARNDPGYPLAA